MTTPLFHVDAFADKPFSGNPAAVCILPGWKEDRWLQAVGGEMNLSETAFLVQNTDGFDLRWFTPRAEVDLCGHATLASAHVLWKQGLAKSTEVIHFATKSGLLRAVPTEGAIELDFPLEPDEPADPPANLLSALGVSARYVGRNRLDYVVEVESERVIRRIAPDFKVLETIPCRGVIVTSPSANPQFDFVSRAFFPRLGVDEDPVCGSAHCCLGPFWQRRMSKSNFVAYQASVRGGVVKVRVTKDRAFLGGRAVIVAKGELLE